LHSFIKMEFGKFDKKLKALFNFKELSSVLEIRR
jgi:hypothetical protein